MSNLYWDTFVMKNTMPVGMINETSFFEKLQEDDDKQQYGVIMHRIKLSKSLRGTHRDRAVGRRLRKCAHTQHRLDHGVLESAA